MKLTKQQKLALSWSQDINVEKEVVPTFTGICMTSDLRAGDLVTVSFKGTRIIITKKERDNA